VEVICCLRRLKFGQFWQTMDRNEKFVNLTRLTLLLTAEDARILSVSAELNRANCRTALTNARKHKKYTIKYLNSVNTLQNFLTVIQPPCTVSCGKNPTEIMSPVLRSSPDHHRPPGV
jgi:hypothetical protein